jgi:anti-sigma regulatory factor (Ser/Thr protein kinase)
MAEKTAVTFDGDPRNVGHARRWIHDRLSPPDVSCRADLVDDAVLVVSELMTNAIRAGSRSVTVAVSFLGRCVRVAVTDDAPGTPTPRAAAPSDRSGRGLPVVAGLSTEWGVIQHGATKQVWADLSLS